MTKNTYTPDEYDEIMRFMRDHYRRLVKLDPHAWKRSHEFHALCADVSRHSPESIQLKVIHIADTLGYGTRRAGDVWTKDKSADWIGESLKRIGDDTPPETFDDMMRRLGGADLFGDVLGD
jgi:hypothetical protein